VNDRELPQPACDSHFHVFGDPSVYPPVAQARYLPHPVSIEQYLQVARGLALRRAVIVQPSVYGTDNRCTLDACRTLGDDARAIVDVDALSLTDAELEAMHRAGARGVRMNVTLSQPEDSELARHIAEKTKVLASRIRPLGWHVEFLSPSWLTGALLPGLEKLDIDCCFAHFGGLNPTHQSGERGRNELLSFMKDSGRGWIKISAAYRVAPVSAFSECRKFVETLMQTTPQRVLWGSDHPHSSYQDLADTGRMLSLLRQWLPGQEHRRQVLVDNPTALYGFKAPHRVLP
jgi:predicted TIM-barrel fold metal-dependent hydrolase